MFHSRKNIATIRRSSQRRNSQRLARIQRQMVLETVISNMSSFVYQHCDKIPAQHYLESVQVAAQHNDNIVDNPDLSMSVGSLNISDEHVHVLESRSNIEINVNHENESGENQSIMNLNNAEQVEVDEEMIEDLNSDANDDEDNEEEILLSGSDDDDSSSETDYDDLFNDFENSTNRDFTSMEIAVALSLLKSRHSLTNSCISNICKLLKLLRVHNCPSDFRQVRSLICKPYQSTISGEILILCPSCHKISSNSAYCTSSPTCINRNKFIMNPTINHTLHIEPQIRSVLERNNLIKPKDNETIITDIIDSSFYRKLLRTESRPFITLLMNSDGAVVKSISRSIWITTFVINELSPNVRFNRENLIIGMLSIGSSKPQKNEMQIFLGSLAKKLLDLENKGVRYNPFNSASHMEKESCVYLIAATCDMPATSLLINHTEANSYFGCTHCKIIGENVKVGDGYSRAFVHDNNNDVEIRSNASYDAAIRLLEKPSGRRRRSSINSINNGLDGLRGSCVLRTLKHFDVYQSFVSDTLHTLYEGVTARMLRIFFGNVSKKSCITEEMSIKKSLDVISSTFKSMFYPSSTFRIPRDIKLYTTYKANELKICLLFGYSIFEHILTPERYDHFRYLAFAAHLIESAKYDQSTYSELLDLLEEFDKRFESLYTKKQAKPVIHALSHFPHSIKQYGPAHNYSTFEFESVVATLTRTVHNGNRPTIELLNNIDLLQQTWLATKDPSFSPEIRLFDHQIHSSMRYFIPRYISDLHHSRHQIRVYRKVSITSLEADVSDFVIKHAGDRPYALYKTILVYGQRYSADSINIHRTTHDGCILYNKNGTPTIGFLETIIYFINNNEFSLVMRPVILYSTADTLSINGRLYRCTNVLYGTSHGSSIEAVHYKFLMQKLAFRYGTNSKFSPIIKSMFFYQFPNLRSST